MIEIICAMAILLLGCFAQSLHERELVSAEIASFMKIIGTPLT